MCVSAYATTLSPQLQHTLYELQYTLAKRPYSFTATLDAVDMLLGYYATQYTDDTILTISTERRKKENTSYLWQEILIKVHSSEEFTTLLKALHALSPYITIKHYNSTSLLYIHGIPTHTLHVENISLPITQKYSYLTIIIDDVGENLSLLKQFTHLPLQLTFAVWPFASKTKSSVKHLSTTQQSTIIHFPMEPIGYPNVNPGKGALTTTMTQSEIETQVRKALLAIPNAIGINNHMGSSFTSNMPAVQYFIASVATFNPQLYIVDSLTHAKSLLYSNAKRAKLHAFTRNIFIDNIRTEQDTLMQLYKAQDIAQKYGKAIAIGHLAPTTLAALQKFIQSKHNNVRIIPLEGYAKL